MKTIKTLLLISIIMWTSDMQFAAYGQVDSVTVYDSGRSELPPHWSFINTGIVVGIIIPDDAIISIYGNEPNDNTWLGVFYIDEFGEEKCGGFRKYNPANTFMLTAFGNDAFTPEKDGFDLGEKYNWRIYCGDSQTEYRAVAVYQSQIDPDCYFFPGVICTVGRIDAALTLQIELPAGWSGFSLPMSPITSNIEQIFSGLDDVLVILQNNEFVYWPDAGINTFPGWEPFFGAQIKLEDEAVMEITGIPSAGTIYLSEGWNYLPVMSLCDVDASPLFTPIQNKIEIVKAIAGPEIYWPEAGIYTLETLYVGKAYLILMNEPATIIYPDCD